ncbi:hypothetical protein [Gottfriedia luciferensis]|uniref:hypothetical protein n=1 Tax=Gottfriedia luciferensis TaxID=178774 RepID=UPI000B43AB05|nr:hypothetical protein [Gottfriedia luciferensis]
MILRLLPNYFFSLECLYLYLILLLIYEPTNHLPSTLAIICVMMIGNLFLYFSLQKQQISRAIPFFAAIICGLVGFTLGLSSFSSILCGSFIFFRIEAFLKDSSLWLEERNNLPILFYCSSFLLFFVGWTSHFLNMNLVYGLLIIFTVLYSLGRFLQQAVNLHSINNIKGIIGTISIAVILTGIITLILPSIKWVCFKLLNGMINIVGFLGTPLFNSIDRIELKPKQLGPKDASNAKNEMNQYAPNKHFILDSIPSWAWVLLLIIALIIVWLIIRKLTGFKIEKQTNQQKIETEISSIPKTLIRKKRFFNQKAPSEQIRKLIFQLQKYALKNRMGRLPNETLKEWLHRIQFTNADELVNAYDSVRYGNNELKEIEMYEEQVRKFKEKNNRKIKE